MGVALSVASGMVVAILARIIPIRRRAWFAEGAIALAAALVALLAATALDFGGIREPDWRAGAFEFFVAAAAVGVARIVP